MRKLIYSFTLASHCH